MKNTVVIVKINFQEIWYFECGKYYLEEEKKCQIFHDDISLSLNNSYFLFTCEEEKYERYEREGMKGERAEKIK